MKDDGTVACATERCT